MLEFLAATEIDHLVGSGALAVSAAKRMLFSLSDTHVLLPKLSMRPALAEGVAATSMENWGLENTRDYVRLVFANEPVLRLSTLAERFQCAIPA